MKSYGMSHVGKVRKVNQDAFYNRDKALGILPNLYIVADGMGGHLGGEVASKMAVDTIYAYFDKGANEVYLSESIEKANIRIYNEAISNEGLFGMGTTVIVCSIDNNTMFIGHVGDSRLYTFGNSLIQHTKDHSFVQELVDAGAITKEEAMHHPNKNQITRAVGVDKKVNIDMIECDITGERYVLICSDGLTNHVSEQEIIDILDSTESTKKKSKQLVKMALDDGGTDNVTVVIIDLKG